MERILILIVLVDNIMMTMSVDIIPDKLSRNFTHPLEMPRGLKSLLYTLNAIVYPTK
jgi:hypothetical protein